MEKLLKVSLSLIKISGQNLTSNTIFSKILALVYVVSVSSLFVLILLGQLLNFVSLDDFGNAMNALSNYILVNMY